MNNRRDLLKWCAASTILAAGGSFAKSVAAAGLNPDIDSVTEDQRGDPDTDNEYVTFSPAAIRRIVNRPGKATFESWDATLPISMVATARQFIGCSRTATPQQITKFLGLFNLPISTDKGYVPFCAAGLSYCALLTYSSRLYHTAQSSISADRLRLLMPDLEHYYFYPTVSCVDMYHIAAGKRRWFTRNTKSSALPKPGWIVLYDWNRSGTPDHCGLVQQATKDNLVTVEFNTSTGEGSQKNGGTVSQRTRTYAYVAGFVVTDARP